MSHKYFDGIVYEPTEIDDIDNELKQLVLETPKKVKDAMNQLKVAEAIDYIFEIFRRSNKYIDETTPWVLAKDPSKQERLKTVLYNLLESIRSGAVLLQAFLPETADEIFSQLNTQNRDLESINFEGMDPGIKLNEPKPLFARINKEEKLEELSNK